MPEEISRVVSKPGSLSEDSAVDSIGLSRSQKVELFLRKQSHMPGISLTYARHQSHICPESVSHTYTRQVILCISIPT